MKKLITIFAALFIGLMASAQNYEWTGPFGMSYVNLNGGVVSSLNAENFNGFVQGVKPVAGLEVGTYFTPVWGASVEGLGFFGTTTSKTLFDESAVLANGKLNFSNLLGGYNEQPRRVEVVGVLGYGWGHDYVASSYGQYRTSEAPIVVDGLSDEVAGLVSHVTDKNYTVYKAGAELNVNLGKARAWQLNVRPGVLWFHKQAGNYVSTPVMTTKRDGRVYLEFGVTYKPKNRRINSNNFVKNYYSVMQEDYDAKLAELEAEKNKPAKEVVKEVVRTEKVVEKEVRVLVGSNIITFPIGSCVLSETESAKVKAFVDSLDDDTLIHVLGSADSKTGGEERNNALAQNRARVVKKALTDLGVSEDRIETDYTLDATDNALTSRSAVLTLSVE